MAFPNSSTISAASSSSKTPPFGSPVTSRRLPSSPLGHRTTKSCNASSPPRNRGSLLTSPRDREQTGPETPLKELESAHATQSQSRSGSQLLELRRLRTLFANVPITIAGNLWANFIQSSKKRKDMAYAHLADTALKDDALMRQLIQDLYHNLYGNLYKSLPEDDPDTALKKFQIAAQKYRLTYRVEPQSVFDAIETYLKNATIHPLRYCLEAEEQQLKEKLVEKLEIAAATLCSLEVSWADDINTAINAVRHPAFPPHCLKDIKALLKINAAETIQMLISVFLHKDSPILKQPKSQQSFPEESPIYPISLRELLAESLVVDTEGWAYRSSNDTGSMRGNPPQSQARSERESSRRELFPEFPSNPVRAISNATKDSDHDELLSILITEITEKGFFLTTNHADLAINALLENPDCFESRHLKSYRKSLQHALDDSSIRAVLASIDNQTKFDRTRPRRYMEF